MHSKAGIRSCFNHREPRLFGNSLSIHAGSDTVTAWAGLALVSLSRAVREERGQIYSEPKVLKTTNRYNEDDGVSKRVHELAFGIVICFGSEG